MRRTSLRVPLVKLSRRRRLRSFRLDLSKPWQWQRARDYLTGDYKRRAAEVIWSGPIGKLLRR